MMNQQKNLSCHSYIFPTSQVVGYTIFYLKFFRFICILFLHLFYFASSIESKLQTIKFNAFSVSHETIRSMEFSAQSVIIFWSCRHIVHRLKRKEYRINCCWPWENYSFVAIVADDFQCSNDNQESCWNILETIMSWFNVNTKETLWEKYVKNIWGKHWIQSSWIKKIEVKQKLPINQLFDSCDILSPLLVLCARALTISFRCEYSCTCTCVRCVRDLTLNITSVLHLFLSTTFFVLAFDDLYSFVFSSNVIDIAYGYQ